MFDNLREQASFEFEEEDADALLQGSAPKPRASRPFLGLRPEQRFILSVLLLMTVCSIGSLCLLISGRFWLF